MTVAIDFWTLVGSLLGAVAVLVGGFWAIGERMFSRFEGHVQQQLGSMKQSIEIESEARTRLESDLLRLQLPEQLGSMKQSIQVESEARMQLEKDLLRFQAALPEKFVARDDYIRNQTVIEAKLDAIASEVKVVQIQGAKRG